MPALRLQTPAPNHGRRNPQKIVHWRVHFGWGGSQKCEEEPSSAALTSTAGASGVYPLAGPVCELSFTELLGGRESTVCRGVPGYESVMATEGSTR